MDTEKLRQEFNSYCEEQLIYPREIYFQIWWASREALVVKMPEAGYWMGWGNDELMRAEEVREALSDSGLKVSP